MESLPRPSPAPQADQTTQKTRRTRASKYAMKIVPSPKTYRYHQVGQPTDDEFSLAYRVDDTLFQLFNPVRCREYFADIFGTLEGVRKDVMVYGMNIQEIAKAAEGKELWLLHHNNLTPELFNDGDILLPGNTVACPVKPEWIETSIAITYHTAIMRWRRNVPTWKTSNAQGVWLTETQRQEVEQLLPHLRKAAESLGLNGFYCVQPQWADNSGNHARGFYAFYNARSNVNDEKLKQTCREMAKAA